MKHNKLSLKWKIFMYMLGFVALLLMVLWFFQTIYLDTFYRSIKLKEVKDAMCEVEASIDNSNLAEEVEKIALEYNISIMVGDVDGNIVTSAENNENQKFSRFNTIMVKLLYHKAEGKKGIVEIDVKSLLGSAQNTYEFDGKGHGDASPFNAKIIYDKDGASYILVVHCALTPVNATVHTLKIQLIYITIIMILLSLGLAFVIAKTVSRSIVKVNASAKKLAEGDYEVEFDGNDYKEISELSDTLNNTVTQLSKSEILQRELIANVSHDLRTPLTMITAYSEVMRDIPGENTPENVQVIIDEAKRLTILVNDLMDISKIQAGVTTLETKEYDITESIKNTVERYSKLLEPYDYDLTFEYTEHAIIEGDEFKIYQVIYNLIGNAVNYTGDDKTIKVVQKITGNIVRIEVSDTGVGIAPEKLDAVWERYYKIDKTHKRAVVGTGLGLSIVKNILKLHKANFGVDSEVGKGSTFWFEIRKEE